MVYPSLCSSTTYRNSFNPVQLYSNLYSKVDLGENVLIIANMIGRTYPAPISETLPAFLTYYVDLSGNLFGNTVCGINNYENYIVYNPPYTSNNAGDVNHL